MRAIPLTIFLFCSTLFAQQFNKIVSGESGIDFKNTITETEKINVITYPYLYNGGGVAIGDVNNDGLEDIYFTGNQVDDKLFLNQGGLKFKDVTKKYFKNQEFGFHTGASMVDINNDGWLDICVSAAGPSSNAKDRRNKLFINQEGKGFVDKATEYGLDDTLNTTQTVFFDVDGDGDLDAYVLNHSLHTRKLQKSSKGGKAIFVPGKDKLMINQDGHFVDQSETFGIFSAGFGLGIAISDFNNDFKPDIYVTSDFDYPDVYYMSSNKLNYRVSMNEIFRSISKNSTGVDVADFNNDGWVDIFTADINSKDVLRSNKGLGNLESDYYVDFARKIYSDMRAANALQLNMNGSFLQIAHMSGVAYSDWSWSTLFADFNLDGYQDLYIATGCPADYRDQTFLEAYHHEIYDGEIDMTYESIAKLIPRLKLQDRLYLSNKDLTFQDATKLLGFDQEINVNGAAYADLDNDGDLDLVCNALNDASFIMQNNSVLGGHYLKLKLIGPQKNMGAIGAKVKLYVDELVMQREAYSARGYQSSVSPILHFGLTSKNGIDSVEIYWNSNEKTVLRDIESDQLLKVDYALESKSGFKFNIEDEIPFERTKFSGIERSHENKHAEIEIEGIGWDKFGKLGPAVVVADLNGDGMDDFFLGGSKGQTSKVYYQNENGGFDLDKSNVWQNTLAYEDMEAVFIDFDKDNDLDLYVVSGGFGQPNKDSLLNNRLYVNNGTGRWTAPKGVVPADGGADKKVIKADLNKDGWMDLVIFGRHVPGAYPNAANSKILINIDGRFKDETAKMAPVFNRLGMVTDASCLDLDNDGDLDFVVVGEWMPVTIIENDQGVFKDVTDEYGLENSKGWWTSIEILEMDGKNMKFVLGNLGENTAFHASKESPYRLEMKNVLNANGAFEATTFSNSYLYLSDKRATIHEMPQIYQSGPINTMLLGEFGNNDEQTILYAGNYFDMKETGFICNSNPIWLASYGQDYQAISLRTKFDIMSGAIFTVGRDKFVIFSVYKASPEIFKYDLK